VSSIISKGQSTIPDFSYEAKFPGIVVGIDEVGRGPLAGPVMAAAYVFKTYDIPKDLFEKIDDSKKLTPLKRQNLVEALKMYGYYAIGSASVKEIDDINILQASFLAMQRALMGLKIIPAQILVDGKMKPPFPYPTLPIIQGDSKSLSIAAASILAKVKRDELMMRLSHRYPHYAWQKNAGYGTKEHREAIDAYGITKHHRLSFAPMKNMLANETNQESTRLLIEC
jgi:ribonuclease HII